MSYQVFISHSHKDKAVADAICNNFESNNIRCWIAPRDIEPGANWASSIAEAIPKVKIMVLVFSNNANMSKQVLREVEMALSHDVILLPFKIEDVKSTGGMSYYLSTVHWIDAISGDTKSNIAKLKGIVDKLLDSNTAPQAIDKNAALRADVITAKAKKKPWIIYIAVAAAVLAIIVLQILNLLNGQKADANIDVGANVENIDEQENQSMSGWTDFKSDVEIEGESNSEGFTIVYHDNDDNNILYILDTMDSFYQDGAWYVNYATLKDDMGWFYTENDTLVFENFSSRIILFEGSGAIVEFYTTDGILSLPVNINRIDKDDKIYVPLELIIGQVTQYEYSEDGTQMDVQMTEDYKLYPVYEEYIENNGEDFGEYITEFSLTGVKSDSEDFRIVFTGDDTHFDKFYISKMDSLYKDGIWYVNYVELGDDSGFFSQNDDVLVYEYSGVTVLFRVGSTEVIFYTDDVNNLPINVNRIDQDEKIYIPYEIMMNQINDCKYTEDGKIMLIRLITDSSQMPIYKNNYKNS